MQVLDTRRATISRAVRALTLPCLAIAFLVALFTQPIFTQQQAGAPQGARGGNAPAGPPPAPAVVPYIDAHTHPDQTDMAGSVEAAVQAMPKENAKQIVFLPPPFLADNPEKFDAEQIMAAANKYPDKIRYYGGGGSLNGMLHQSVRTGSAGPEVQAEFKK